MREERTKLVAELKRKLSETGVSPTSLKAVVGLDGFVDEILHAVDKRFDAHNYSRIERITDLSDRIRSFEGKSGNMELVTQRIKIGGNGPIMANTVAQLGARTTYIGNLGRDEIHPVFKPMQDSIDVISLADAAHTDAVEFKDGKIMLGKMMPLVDVNWERMLEVAGEDRLVSLLAEADLLALVNWTMITDMTRIWRHLISDICPKLPEKRRFIFIDLADPEKRSMGDINEMLDTLGQFSKYYNVIFGLNEREAEQIAQVLGLSTARDEKRRAVTMCSEIAGELDIYSVVVHPTSYAVTVTGGELFIQDGPVTQHPRITTGAGDHFNAGFCIGQLLGAGPDASLLMGVCCSGYYVRNGVTPDFGQLVGFLDADWNDRAD